MSSDIGPGSVRCENDQALAGIEKHWKELQAWSFAIQIDLSII